MDVDWVVSTRAREDGARRTDLPGPNSQRRGTISGDPLARTLSPFALYSQRSARIVSSAPHGHHDRILHGLKLRAPGCQAGGRARAAVPRRDRPASPGIGRTLRGLEGRHAGLSEVEARAPRGARRDRKIVARGTLTTVPPGPDPGRCVVWTRWPVARRTPRNHSIIQHRCASQSLPAAATPRV